MPGAQRSCLRCISKKRKCDHGDPTCSLCVKTRAECRYPPDQQRRGPIAGTTRALETRIVELEGALNYLLEIDEVRTAIDRKISMGQNMIPAHQALSQMTREEQLEWIGAHPLRTATDLLDYGYPYSIRLSTDNTSPEKVQRTSTMAVPSIEVSNSPYFPGRPDPMPGYFDASTQPLPGFIEGKDLPPHDSSSRGKRYTHRGGRTPTDRASTVASDRSDHLSPFNRTTLWDPSRGQSTDLHRTPDRCTFGPEARYASTTLDGSSTAPVGAHPSKVDPWLALPPSGTNLTVDQVQSAVDRPLDRQHPSNLFW